MLKFLESSRYKPLVILFAIIVLVSIMLYLTSSSYLIKIDNVVIGLVKDKEQVYKLLDEIKADMKSQLGLEVKISEEISFDRTFIPQSKLTPLHKVKEALEEKISFQAEAYSINVNDKDLFFLKDELTAQQLIKSLKNEYLGNLKGEELKEISFVDKVEILKKDTDIEHIINLDNALKQILEGKGASQKYEVLEGDTVWDISIKQNISIEDIERLNPDINIDKLQIGQQIIISAPQPLINVKTVELSTTEESIPYEITFQKTDTLYIGQENVKKSGKNGNKIMQAEITKVNGVLTNIDIIKEDIILQPEDEIVLIGAKQAPSTFSVASRSGAKRTQPLAREDKFSWPTPGYYNITSTFGNRIHPILKVRKMHTGIDTSAPLGADVVAADKGIVTVSEASSSYGNRIIIDHGDGFSTMYAHNSKLLVNVGELVERGQVIAKVGSTGRSTGPHAHFEVLINGKAVDPMLYLSK